MSRLIVDFEAIFHNIKAVDAMVRKHGASWTLATNALCGDSTSISALHTFGVRSIADTRPQHMEAMGRLSPGTEKWYMRLPEISHAASVVSYSEVSLNSEMETIVALNDAAAAQGRRHSIVLMVELGDLSEGIFAGDLLDFYTRAQSLPQIEVLGLGGNLGFQKGVAPNVDRLNQLAMFRELLELKYQTRLPVVSAGTSAVLPLLSTGGVPAEINHFRVGESVFLGTDLVNGGQLEGLRPDGVVLEAEVVEVKKKTLFYQKSGSSMSPFAQFEAKEYSPGERGFRAVVGVGQVDTETAGLTPVNDQFTILGAGSDLVVVDLAAGGCDVSVGDMMQFRPSYRALMRLMASPYVEKSYRGNAAKLGESGFVLPPVVDTNGMGE